MNNIINILLVLAVVGTAIWATVRMRQMRKSNASRLERAVWAWAKIINSTSETTASGNWAHVALELEVHAPGTQVCIAKTNWLVERESLEYVEAGKEISVKADPLDPRYVFPNGPWARFEEKK